MAAEPTEQVGPASQPRPGNSVQRHDRTWKLGAGPKALVTPCALGQVISGDSFFKVALAAWSHLSPATWQAIRRINKTGRTIHDERVTDLPLWLGRAKPGSTEAEAGVPREQVATRALRATYPPDLTELRSTLGALARRKAPVQCLRLHFHKREAGHLPVKDRAEQL